MNEQIIKSVIRLLETTLGSMNAAQADNVVKECIAILKTQTTQINSPTDTTANAHWPITNP